MALREKAAADEHYMHGYRAHAALSLGHCVHPQSGLGYQRAGGLFLVVCAPEVRVKLSALKISGHPEQSQQVHTICTCGHEQVSSSEMKASIIYKATGNLRAVQILIGHTKIDSTVRYFGVDVEDALELAECAEV